MYSCLFITIIPGYFFELLNSFSFGPAVTVVVGVPTSVFLVYAAIKKGAAETEEDDRKYGQ